MKHSESIIGIAQALLEVQKELKNTAQTAENPFYHSSYAPLNKILDEVRPICNKHGITILQDVYSENGNLYVSTMLLHKSGEWMQQEGMWLPLEKPTPQSSGSAVTYGRRYTISAMLGIATEEDDDGNAGEKQKKDFSSSVKDEFSGTEIYKPGQEIPKEYWKLEGKDRYKHMPKGYAATKGEDGKWYVKEKVE
jgi:hypothetical protein